MNNNVFDVMSLTIDNAGVVAMQSKIPVSANCVATGTSSMLPGGKAIGEMDLVFSGADCLLPAGAMQAVYQVPNPKEIVVLALSSDKQVPALMVNTAVILEI